MENETSIKLFVITVACIAMALASYSTLRAVSSTIELHDKMEETKQSLVEIRLERCIDATGYKY